MLSLDLFSKLSLLTVAAIMLQVAPSLVIDYTPVTCVYNLHIPFIYNIHTVTSSCGDFLIMFLLNIMYIHRARNFSLTWHYS